MHKYLAPLAGAALLVALGVAVTFWALGQIEAAAGMRKHAFVVLNAAEDVLSALKDAETGQRGYLLTGDEAFLEPYLAVRGGFSQSLGELRKLASIDAAQQHLDALAPLIDAKLIEMSLAIELRRNQDMAAALASVRSGQGRPLMDAIRAEMGRFLQVEEGALAQHDAEFQWNMRRLFILILAGSVLILLLAIFFVYSIHRQARQRLEELAHRDTQALLALRDQTNRQLQQANVSLQDSAEKLAVTLNSIGDAVIATDAEGCVTLLNPLAEQLTGWTQAEAAGRPAAEIFRIISQETRQAVAVPVIEALAHGTVQGLPNHTLLIARDGSERPIADTCAPIRDLGEQVVGTVLVFRDVSTEYAAQQAVRDHAAQIETIFNTVTDGIITIHARGGIIEAINPAALRMFGYPIAELAGQYFSLLIPALDRDQRNGSLEYYSASEEARAVGQQREVVGQRKDGSFLPMEMTVSEMWLSGQRYFAVILRDIALRKQADEALPKLQAA